MAAHATTPEPLDTTAAIESPEHVRFHYTLAGPGKRALAYFIDLVIRGAVLVVVALVAAAAGAVGGEDFGGLSIGFMLVFVFLLDWGYYVLFETLWSGRTPGKRALNLRVVAEGGQPLHFVDSVLRNLLRAADALPPLWAIPSYAIGVAVMCRDKRFRRLGDMVAGTIVIVEDRQAVVAPLRIEPPPSPQELAWLPERLPLSSEDLDAIELLLRRHGKLATAREYELAEMVSGVFAKRLSVRPRDSLRFLQLLYHVGRVIPAARALRPLGMPLAKPGRSERLSEGLSKGLSKGGAKR